MGSDESGHSESEFYYSEEDNFNQMTPINRDEVEQERHLTAFKILSTHFALITLGKRQLEM